MSEDQEKQQGSEEKYIEVSQSNKSISQNSFNGQDLNLTKAKDQIEYAKFLSENKLIPSKFAKNPAAVFRVIQMGRELGIPDQMALAQIDDIDGNLTANKNLKLALLKREGIDVILNSEKDSVRINEDGLTLKEYLEVGGERKDFKAVDAYTEVTFRYKSKLDGKIIEQPFRAYWSDAVKAELTDKSNWKKMPRKMLRAEAVRNGAMFVAPQSIFLYDTAEMVDIKSKGSYPESEINY